MKRLNGMVVLLFLGAGLQPMDAWAQEASPWINPARMTSAQTNSLQNAEEEVLTVVRKLFDGMRRGDGELLKSLFHPDALMTGTGLREGTYQATMSPPDGWIQSVSSNPGRDLDERIYDPKVEVSGPLASVWTEYDLYVDGEFRHCGVDAFHLALTAEGWKIVHLADTRVQGACPKR